jgi:hypothetical protein
MENRTKPSLKIHFNGMNGNVTSWFLVNQKKVRLINMAMSLLFIFTFGCKSSPDIKVQNMKMKLPQDSQIFSEELLHGEIADTKIEHFCYAGPGSQTVALSSENANMFVFIKGNGSFLADTMTYNIVPESIAIPFSLNSITIKIPAGDTVHFVKFTKKLSVQDLEDMKAFPAENKFTVYFKKFSDCTPYTEKIKSPNTVSRTVLPADILPRVSLGTVGTSGPDAVGAHKHPMLDQLFLGLAQNDITVHADDKSVNLGEFSILHIPTGSSHWATVEKDKKMYYLWMDFFLTKEGQIWLKTHKPISTDKK